MLRPAKLQLRKPAAGATFSENTHRHCSGSAILHQGFVAASIETATGAQSCIEASFAIAKPHAANKILGERCGHGPATTTTWQSRCAKPSQEANAGLQLETLAASVATRLRGGVRQRCEGVRARNSQAYRRGLLCVAMPRGISHRVWGVSGRAALRQDVRTWMVHMHVQPA